MSLRDQILATDDLRREAVVVPEWGDITVWVTMLGLADRLAYERWAGAQPDDSDETAVRLVILTLTDEAGIRAFSEDDAKALLAKSPDVLLRLGEVAARVNRIGNAAGVPGAKGES